MCPDSPENKCPEPESQVAVHPVWGCDNEAIKDEFRRLQAERDKYLEWFQKADSELERLHFENEQRESGRSTSPDRETGSEEIHGPGGDLHQRMKDCGLNDRQIRYCLEAVEATAEPSGATTSVSGKSTVEEGENK